MRVLPVSPAWRLAERAPELRWLVTHLWSQDAVGIVGGEPKCCKSFLALDLAVAVAAGVPWLRRFPGVGPRRVLLYGAQEAHSILMRRVGRRCAGRPRLPSPFHTPRPPPPRPPGSTFPPIALLCRRLLPDCSRAC